MSHDRQGAGAPNFTPGRWEATQDRHLGLFVCSKDNHDNQICEISTHNGADAHLIAAAPELYAALEAMRAEFRAADLPYGSKAYLQSGEALAKARGEA